MVLRVPSERDDDYITVNPAVAHNKFNVCIMRWTTDGHVAARVSEQLNRTAADALAQSWAAATQLSIR